jgi:hypothetical protein
MVHGAEIKNINNTNCQAYVVSCKQYQTPIIFSNGEEEEKQMDL